MSLAAVLALLVIAIPGVRGQADSQAASKGCCSDPPTGTAYRYENVATAYPCWMRAVPDSTPLSQLSLPGSHDSMAHRAVVDDAISMTQSMNLTQQLNAGVRALDIRCRRCGQGFLIHHGFVYLRASFDDVLSAAAAWLRSHPSEALLMRVKEEFEPCEGSRPFADSFAAYWNKYPALFWRGASNNPALGDMRGKVVVLQNFASNARFGIPYSSLAIQDSYALRQRAGLYDKWLAVKQQLVRAVKGDVRAVHMNYLSAAPADVRAAIGGVFPYWVASGKSLPATYAPAAPTDAATCPTCDNGKWPDFPRANCRGGWCRIMYRGTNFLAEEWMAQSGVRGRVGIIMADFPGERLIKRVMNQNVCGSSCTC